MSTFTPPDPQSAYSDPLFSGWAPAQALALTAWLFGDKNINKKYWDDPKQWHKAGEISIVDRSLDFAAVASGATTAPLSLNLGGGRNVVVFQRVAAVTLTTPAAAANTLPLLNQLAPEMLIEQKRDDGLVEIQQTALSNVFGYGWAPHILPFPERWQGNAIRKFTLVNNNSAGLTVDVHLSWKIAFLNVGA